MTYSRWKAFAFTLALILLVAACPLCAQDAAAWADFQQKAAAWRALPVKPSLSDDLKRERLLAENAVSEKRFQDAVSHYEAGLKLNPMWPEGHFNAALIEAELEDYDKAIWNMRAYVELVPDATDAREARDQIAIWQDKMKLLESVSFRDPATGLMWTKKDNGSDVTWQAATDYCRNLQLAGHGDWRLPTIDELRGISDPNLSEPDWQHGPKYQYHVKGQLQISGWEWCSFQGNASGKEWGVYSFAEPRYSLHFGSSKNDRALCVRRSGE